MTEMKIFLNILTVALIIAAMLMGTADAEAPRRNLTIMVYMCGSNLESDGGAASTDMAEMAAGLTSHDIGLLVMTGGSAKWQNGMDAGHTYITEIGTQGRSRVVDTRESTSMGDPETLEYFTRFAKERYPAQDYALIIWNHGNGPLGGVCVDEMYWPDTLSLQEIGRALSAAQFPRKLKWIGFDACLMSTVEVANAIAPYAEYMIASQDTEPDTGWDYSFLQGIENDVNGLETARRIIDLYAESPCDDGRMLTLSCIDLSRISAVISAMDGLFKNLSSNIDISSFSRISDVRLSSVGFGRNVCGIGMEGYDLVDLKDLTRKFGDEYNAQQLLNALGEAVVYALPASDAVGGLSVYHPFYNKKMFEENWANDYRNLSFCPGYSSYVAQFGKLLLTRDMTDWLDLETVDRGYTDEGVNRFSLQLTKEQQAAFSSAQLIALFPRYYNRRSDEVVSEKFNDALGVGEDHDSFSPVYVGNAVMDGNGLVTASYSGRALYVTDAAGEAVLGPIAYRLTPDGQTYCLCAEYSDTSGREDSAFSTKVLYSCSLNEDNTLSVMRTDVYDPLTDTYSNRIAFDPERYTLLTFDNMKASRPANTHVFQNIHLSFEYGGGALYRFLMAQITMKDPTRLTKADGELLDSEDYTVQLAPPEETFYSGLMNVLSIPVAEKLKPRTLVAPLSDERIAKFDHGEVSICIKTHDYEDREEIEPRFLLDDSEGFDPYAEYVSFALVDMDLEVDEQGRISAQYSGMLPRTIDEFLSVHEKTTGTQTVLSASLYSYPDNYGYYNYRIYSPKEKSDHPCIVPVDVPDEDVEGIDLGVRTDLCFKLQNKGNSLLVKEITRSDYAQLSETPRDHEPLNMNWWLMLMRRVNEDHWDSPELFYRYCGYECFIHMSMHPIEDFDQEFCILYHIVYTDGTEESIVEEY